MIYIEEIIAAFEKTKINSSQFLNKKTGEIVTISERSHLASEDEKREEVEENNDYVMLPDQYELDEWYVMADFAESLDNKDLRHTLIEMLNKQKQSQNIKTEMRSLGIYNDYRSFKKKEFYKKAVEWCLENDIEYSCKTSDVENLCEEYKKQYWSE